MANEIPTQPLAVGGQSLTGTTAAGLGVGTSVAVVQWLVACAAAGHWVVPDSGTQAALAGLLLPAAHAAKIGVEALIQVAIQRAASRADLPPEAKALVEVLRTEGVIPEAGAKSGTEASRPSALPEASVSTSAELPSLVPVSIPALTPTAVAALAPEARPEVLVPSSLESQAALLSSHSSGEPS